METRELELHDSSIKAIVNVDKQLIVFMIASIHNYEKDQNKERHSTWWQAIALIITNPIRFGNVEDYPIRILDGNLTAEGKKYYNCFPIPFSHENVEMELKLENLESLNIKGDSIEIVTIGYPEYEQEFPQSVNCLAAT